jgi:hypothetical protein
LKYLSARPSASLALAFPRDNAASGCTGGAPLDKSTHYSSSTASTLVVAALVTTLFLLSTPPTASAQPCGGTVFVPSLGNGAGVMNPTGCTTGAVTDTSPVGNANTCFVGGSGMSLNAIWANMTARDADSTGGCIFMCPSGTCKVGNDGLPVELLSFGVE